MDLLQLVDNELEYTDDPAPSLLPGLLSSYRTPPIAQPELIDKRREGEPLNVLVLSCHTQQLLLHLLELPQWLGPAARSFIKILRVVPR